MRRSARALAPLLLLLGACAAPEVVVSRDTTLSGHLKTKTFRVDPGVVVSAPADLVVESEGPVVIEGRVRGEVGSGASIEIRVSTGDCVVDGALEAGSGADGEEPGEDGGTGGSVRLRADRGAVRARGALAAGAGGEGAGRREQGRGDLRVVSGAGGAGGDVEILAGAVVLDAGATAGDGGAGGGAFAQIVELAPGAPNLLDSGESMADEEEDGADAEPLPGSGSASVLSRAGGGGGSILISAAALESPLAPLRAGSGGATSRASARGGNAASAELEKPGAGGDVSLRVAGLTPAATGWPLVPGPGGDAGLLGAVSAEAYARTAAGARTAGGGEGGKVLLGAAVAKRAAGGDGGDVLVQTDGDAKFEFGGPGNRAAAGKPAASRAP